MPKTLPPLPKFQKIYLNFTSPISRCPTHHLDNPTEELLLEPVKSDSEVDDGEFDTIFWRVLRVAEAGGEIQVKVLVVLDVYIHY